jgi:hypothetical protein
MDANVPEKPPFDFRKSLPYLVLFSLVLVLFLSSTLSQRPPEVRAVSPDDARPGEEVVVKGRFFGRERNGARVSVNGYSPPSSAYLSWADREISLIVPEEMPAGLFAVVTKHGESREVVPFTNEAHVPTFASGPLAPGQPYVNGFEPRSGPPGTLVTISGINFGLDRGTARVEFAWIQGDRTRLLPDTAQDDVLPALEYNQDYVSWEDREIKVRVPDGASSGSLRVVTDKGESNPVYFEVQDTVGTKLFTNKRIYHVQYGVDIADVAASGPSGRLRLWVPRLLQGPSQREVRMIARDPEPLFDNFEGLTLFEFDGVGRGDRRSVSQSFMVSAYEVEAKISPARVVDYDTSTRLYERFTAPDILTPSDNADIVRTARAVTGNEKNPFIKALAVYNSVVAALTFDPQQVDPVQALKIRKGDASTYALLFTSLARAAGIPARPVSGYVVAGEGRAVRHMWAEFYLEQLGWVPVDPALADGLRIGDLPRSLNPPVYYFGNMDSSHIIFSRGLSVLKPMDPRASVVTRRDAPGLQTIHEEYSGAITGYTARWSDLEILGVY